jgi:hypothetical protein
MIAGCPVSGSSMAVLADGTLQVLWYSAGKNGETGLYSSESKDAGKSFGPRVLVDSGETRGTPVLVKNANGLAAVWEGAGDKVMISSLGKSAKALLITAGELPAAVETTASLTTAYVAKTDQHQAVWIISAKREN